MAVVSSLPTKELCSRYTDAESAVSAVRALADSTQAEILDELSTRNPAASCAFLRAVARGESPKPKDFFKD